MRLTLRTLLAYLDNILEPEDRELLEKKIQESEFAQNLIRRSRETLNDQDLSALDPIGHGMRQDPNSVAEYLDNTMPREQIEEFERQCIENGLEADTCLAEITSCHHILTMVLGDPVQFSPSSRDRMYRIAESDSLSGQEDGQRSGGHLQEPATGREYAETTAPIESEFSRQVEDSEAGFNPADLLPTSNVPDYLRGEKKRNRWLPIVATTLVAAVVTGVLLILFEPAASSKNQNGDGSIAKSDSSDNAGSPSVPLDQSPALQGNSTIPKVIENTPPEKTIPDTLEEKNPAQKSIPQESPTTRSVPAPPAENSVSASNEEDQPSPAALPSEETETTSNSEPVPDSTVNDNEPSGIEEPTDTETQSSNARADENNTNTATVPEDTSVEDAGSGGQVLGRLVSDDQILLVTSEGFDQLRYLPPQSNLKKGHQLLALPTFRPNLSLLAFTVELEGGSLLELLDLDEGGTPTVQLSYGRMVLRTNFDGGTLHLKISDTRTITVTLNNTETAIGVEVFPRITSGKDPETAASEHAINIYVLSGSVNWQESTLRGVVEAGQLQGLGRMPPSEPESFSSAPDWLTKVEISNLEKRAVPVVRDVLQEDRPVKLSFQELAEKRRQEVKRLALRCCAYIGYFDPLVEALGDENMNRHWDNCATDLHESIKRHPEYARGVRESIERLRNDQGADLYRMLWGYTNEGLLNQGQANQLVEFLSSEDLDLRVLSHWNLKNITGKGYTFQPNKSESKRRVSVKRWEALLKKGEIKYAPK